MTPRGTELPARPFWRSRWGMPAFCLFLGTLMLAASATGGNVRSGFVSLAIMAALGALFLFGSGASETLRGLGGPGRDERFALMDLQATAASGVAVIAAVLGAFLYEIAQGRDGNPYALLGAVGGVSYVVAVLVLRRRL